MRRRDGRGSARLIAVVIAMAAAAWAPVRAQTAAVPLAAPGDAPQPAPTDSAALTAAVPAACLRPLPPADLPGAVVRNTSLAIDDTPGGTVFTLRGCIQSNGAPGSFAAYLLKGLVFDGAGNLLVFASSETAPVRTAAAADQPVAGLWSMTANAGYPIRRSQIGRTVLLIIYGRACPTAAAADCAKPGYDSGPVYVLLTPCVIDGGRASGGCMAAGAGGGTSGAATAAAPAALPAATLRPLPPGAPQPGAPPPGAPPPAAPPSTASAPAAATSPATAAARSKPPSHLDRRPPRPRRSADPARKPSP